MPECPSCGTNNRVGANYCGQCGSKVAFSKSRDGIFSLPVCRYLNGVAKNQRSFDEGTQYHDLFLEELRNGFGDMYRLSQLPEFRLSQLLIEDASQFDTESTDFDLASSKATLGVLALVWMVDREFDEEQREQLIQIFRELQPD